MMISLTSHRTRPVFSLIILRILPRVLLGITKPSRPGICNGREVSAIWEASSVGESLVISNKVDTPTDLSRKLYLRKKKAQQIAGGDGWQSVNKNFFNEQNTALV